MTTEHEDVGNVPPPPSQTVVGCENKSLRSFQKNPCVQPVSASPPVQSLSEGSEDDD